MGFLKTFGRALDWEESKKHFENIRNDVVYKIIDWIKSAEKIKSVPRYGYEIELHKINTDEESKIARLDLSGEVDVRKVNESSDHKFILQLEYGSWLIECVPKKPLLFENVATEKCIYDMYQFFHDTLGKDNILSISAFPMLGVNTKYFLDSSEREQFSKEVNSADVEIEVKQSEEVLTEYMIKNPISHSLFVDDLLITTHPRFHSMTANIRKRRGSKVEIKIPIYKDENTNLTIPVESEPFPGFIYMDAMAFGMGNACMQVTLGGSTLSSTCYLYDQILPFTPILLALTSSSPIFKGKLAEFDNRFNIIEQSVDDRTEEEKYILSDKYINKSRYSPCYSYISENIYIQDFHNDNVKFPINKEHLLTLMDNGVPRRLAEHFCNLMVRDPLVIFEDKLITEKTDRSNVEIFNSTNWNSLRFKLPREEDNDSCFKVEVRPCDLQLTPFENNAIMKLIVILYTAILKYDVNFIMPITKVDENFKRAYKMDAILKEKFFWRVNGLDNINPTDFEATNFEKPNNNVPSHILDKHEDSASYKELSITEIFLGKEEHNYPGLFKLFDRVIQDMDFTEEEIVELKLYLNLIEKRVKGEVMTDARYIREFVLNHHKYSKDSIVTEEIAYDLIKHLQCIQNGEIIPKELFSDLLN